MLIPLFSVHAKAGIPAREIVKYENGGGSLIMYRHVYSIIVFSYSATKVVFVSSKSNRQIAGLIPTIVTLICGWWSLHGFINTIIALVWNLRGGLDVSEATNTEVQLLGEQTPLEISLESFDRSCRKIGIYIVCVPILGLAVYLGLRR